MKSFLLDLLTSYVAQAIWAAFLALVLFHFFRLYQKKYLRSWAISWSAAMLQSVFAGLSLYMSSEHVEAGDSARLLSTFFTLVGAYVQVAWLVYGTMELVKKRKLKPHYQYYLAAFVLLLALVTTLVFAFDPTAIQERVFVRVGVKALFIAVCFLAAGFILFPYRKDHPGIGLRTVMFSFISFGLLQLQHFMVPFLALFDIQWGTMNSFSVGVVDFLLQAIIGLGLIMWLLEDERQTLERTNTDLDSFLYSTSHDLRAPVASLMGLINLGKMEIKEQKAKEYFDMMEGRIKKLDAIFGDILEYSRSQKSKLQLDKVDLIPLLEDIREEHQFMTRSKHVKMTFPEEKSFMLMSDKAQLKIVFNNLISNAIKYSDPQKTSFVKVRAYRSLHDVVIEVEDNGLGIPKESIAKIFDMFYRAHNKTEGSGLGLFIVKQALGKINGTISLTSEENQGSTFVIRLYNAALAPA